MLFHQTLAPCRPWPPSAPAGSARVAATDVFAVLGAAAGLPGAAHASASLPASNDNFGASLAAGDFNADGNADLAVGVPYEDARATNDGGVNIIYGSATGLSATSVPSQLLGQDSPGIDGTAEADDRFGASLTAADFNGDGRAAIARAVIISAPRSPEPFPAAAGRADRAAGVPDEDASGTNDGGVNVIYGSTTGLSPRPRRTSSSPRTAPASRAPPRARTTSARRSPPATSTPTAAPTWPAACPTKTRAA